jgi:S-DNA-T family DNA segregation ATPase FtsK/SpoIIIE
MKIETHTSRGRGVLKEMAEKIAETFRAFDVPVEMLKVFEGLHFYHFHLKTLKPIRMKVIESFEKDLKYALGVDRVEIQAPIPNEVLVGITVSKGDERTILEWSAVAKTKEFAASDDLVIPLGKNELGEDVYTDLRRAQHLLIGGARGSGKTTFLNSIVNTLVHKHTPDQLRCIFVDPRSSGFVQYNTLPHMLTPTIVDAKKAIIALKWCIKEMERRIDIFSDYQCSNIESYHKDVYGKVAHKKSKPEPMPYIVIIIDELSDLMACYPKEYEGCIVRLTRMSSIVGIHLILSTQRPTVKVVTGLMKANIQTRISFQVASQIDSRIILDQNGAEKLYGKGDMLFLSPNAPHPLRVQGYYLSEKDIQKNIRAVVNRRANDTLETILVPPPQEKFCSSEDDDEDELYEETKQLAIEAGKVSTSYIQRKLRIGYGRAARLIDMLEERGVIGPVKGSEPRKIIEKDDK